MKKAKYIESNRGWAIACGNCDLSKLSKKEKDEFYSSVDDLIKFSERLVKEHAKQKDNRKLSTQL